MLDAQWVEWSRTLLRPDEREQLLAALTPEQEAKLRARDHVWVEGVGVLWKPEDGVLRRARFTHGVHLRTRLGEFYVDSEGSSRAIPDRDGAPTIKAA